MYKNRILISLICLIGLAACGSGTTPPGANTAGGQYEGVSYTLMQWPQGQTIMLWHDVTEASFCDGSGSTDDPVYRLTCQATQDDATRLTWAAQTRNGQDVDFQIDGTAYDLANGTLFLVDTSGSRTAVTQLQRDLTAVTVEREDIIAFAQSDPEIREFTTRQ